MDLHDTASMNQLAQLNPYCVVTWHGKTVGKTTVARQSVNTLEDEDYRDVRAVSCRNETNDAKSQNT